MEHSVIKTKMAVTEGDRLILFPWVNGDQSPEGFSLEPIASVKIINLRTCPMFKWQAEIVDYQTGVTYCADGAGLDIVKVHANLRMAVAREEIIIKKSKGWHMLMYLEIQRGYQLHFSDYVQDKYPYLYAKVADNTRPATV